MINKRKPGKGLEWKLVKEETRKGWGKKCSSSMVIKKLQIKTVTRCYQKTDKTKGSCEVTEPPKRHWSEFNTSTLGKQSGITHITYAIPPLGVHLRKRDVHVLTYDQTHIFILV